MARECLDPDMERAWLPEKLGLLLEFDRFIVEPGCGMAVLELIPPSVFDFEIESATNASYAIMQIGQGSIAKLRTSLGLRTLHRPVSCDMLSPWENGR